MSASSAGASSISLTRGGDQHLLVPTHFHDLRARASARAIGAHAHHHLERPRRAAIDHEKIVALFGPDLLHETYGSTESGIVCTLVRGISCARQGRPAVPNTSACWTMPATRSAQRGRRIVPLAYHTTAIGDARLKRVRLPATGSRRLRPARRGSTSGRPQRTSSSPAASFIRARSRSPVRARRRCRSWHRRTGRPGRNLEVRGQRRRSAEKRICGALPRERATRSRRAWNSWPRCHAIRRAVLKTELRGRSRTATISHYITSATASSLPPLRQGPAVVLR